jgi:hypothetical protein
VFAESCMPNLALLFLSCLHAWSLMVGRFIASATLKLLESKPKPKDLVQTPPIQTWTTFGTRIELLLLQYV